MPTGMLKTIRMRHPYFWPPVKAAIKQLGLSLTMEPTEKFKIIWMDYPSLLLRKKCIKILLLC